MKDKTEMLFLPLSEDGLKLASALGAISTPSGTWFPFQAPFYVHSLSSRLLSGPTESVAVRISDLTFSCHRYHCDVTAEDKYSRRSGE